VKGLLDDTNQYINLKLKEFVQEINQLSSTHQLQSNENMQQVVDKVLSNVDAAV
jgi:hypothetical protein